MATGELIEEVAEEVAAELEEAADATRRFAGRDLGMFFFGSCVGVAGGVAIGYFLAKSRLETKYEQIAREEIDQLREHYLKKAQVVEAKPSLEEVVGDLGYSRSEEETEKDDSDEGESVVNDPRDIVVETNVFDLPEPETPEWDYAAEVKNRDSLRPYVIHKDEYEKNETEFEHVTWAYYEDDDVLANDRDSVVDTDAQDGVVPPDFVNKFGHGSGDPNTVYIRNHEHEIEIEIVRNNGNYGEVVHGFLKHSESGGRRHKPHFDDE